MLYHVVETMKYMPMLFMTTTKDVAFLTQKL